MDELIECSRCGGDACYAVEVAPGIKNFWCYGCGFISNSIIKPDSEFLKEQMEVLQPNETLIQLVKLVRNAYNTITEKNQKVYQQ